MMKYLYRNSDDDKRRQKLAIIYHRGMSQETAYRRYYEIVETLEGPCMVVLSLN